MFSKRIKALKIFDFKGGVHPESHKSSTSSRAIMPPLLPASLYVPLLQHVGPAAEPLVRVGDQVLKGQLIARSVGHVCAPVHAPSSGRIRSIGDFRAPHPSDLPVPTIIIDLDGEDRWIALEPVDDPFSLDADEIATRVGAAGIVGLGGATFPASVKLMQARNSPIETLIINGGECEPFLSCDDRLMREQSRAIIDGVRIIAHVVQPGRTVVAIEDNKPEAIAAMREAAADYENISIAKVPSRYPMGSAKQMIQTVTGREVPAGARSNDIGVLVHNVGTAYAVHRGIRHGQPLISRVVTVAGAAVAQPANVESLIGTLISDLIEYTGGLAEQPARVVMGGPMMGHMLPGIDTPIVKGSSGIIALTENQVESRQPGPCIRCSSCVDACPMGLLPLEMARSIRGDQLENAVQIGLRDCISCGSCSYVCPSNIPLVQYFNYAMGAMEMRQRSDHKAQQTRKLSEARTQRLEMAAKAKAEAAAARKAQRLAAEKAKAAAEKETDEAGAAA